MRSFCDALTNYWRGALILGVGVGTVLTCSIVVCGTLLYRLRKNSRFWFWVLKQFHSSLDLKFTDDGYLIWSYISTPKKNLFLYRNNNSTKKRLLSPSKYEVQGKCSWPPRLRLDIYGLKWKLSLAGVSVGLKLHLPHYALTTGDGADWSPRPVKTASNQSKLSTLFGRRLFRLLAGRIFPNVECERLEIRCEVVSAVPFSSSHNDQPSRSEKPSATLVNHLEQEWKSNRFFDIRTLEGFGHEELRCTTKLRMDGLAISFMESLPSKLWAKKNKNSTRERDSKYTVINVEKWQIESESGYDSNVNDKSSIIKSETPSLFSVSSDGTHIDEIIFFLEKSPLQMSLSLQNVVCLILTYYRFKYCSSQTQPSFSSANAITPQSSFSDHHSKKNPIHLEMQLPRGMFVALHNRGQRRCPKIHLSQPACKGCSCRELARLATEESVRLTDLLIETSRGHFVADFDNLTVTEMDKFLQLERRAWSIDTSAELDDIKIFRVVKNNNIDTTDVEPPFRAVCPRHGDVQFKSPLQNWHDDIIIGNYYLDKDSIPVQISTDNISQKSSKNSSTILSSNLFHRIIKQESEWRDLVMQINGQCKFQSLYEKLNADECAKFDIPLYRSRLKGNIPAVEMIHSSATLINSWWTAFLYLLKVRRTAAGFARDTEYFLMRKLCHDRLCQQQLEDCRACLSDRLQSTPAWVYDCSGLDPGAGYREFGESFFKDQISIKCDQVMMYSGVLRDFSCFGDRRFFVKSEFKNINLDYNDMSVATSSKIESAKWSVHKFNSADLLLGLQEFSQQSGSIDSSRNTFLVKLARSRLVNMEVNNILDKVKMSTNHALNLLSVFKRMSLSSVNDSISTARANGLSVRIALSSTAFDFESLDIDFVSTSTFRDQTRNLIAYYYYTSAIIARDQLVRKFDPIYELCRLPRAVSCNYFLRIKNFHWTFSPSPVSCSFKLIEVRKPNALEFSNGYLVISEGAFVRVKIPLETQNSKLRHNQNGKVLSQSQQDKQEKIPKTINNDEKNLPGSSPPSISSKSVNSRQTRTDANRSVSDEDKNSSSSEKENFFYVNILRISKLSCELTRNGIVNCPFLLFDQIEKDLVTKQEDYQMTKILSKPFCPVPIEMDPDCGDVKVLSVRSLYPFCQVNWPQDWPCLSGMYHQSESKTDASRSPDDAVELKEISFSAEEIFAGVVLGSSGNSSLGVQTSDCENRERLNGVNLSNGITNSVGKGYSDASDITSVWVTVLKNGWTDLIHIITNVVSHGCFLCSVYPQELTQLYYYCTTRSYVTSGLVLSRNIDLKNLNLNLASSNRRQTNHPLALCGIRSKFKTDDEIFIRNLNQIDSSTSPPPSVSPTVQFRTALTNLVRSRSSKEQRKGFCSGSICKDQVPTLGLDMSRETRSLVEEIEEKCVTKIFQLIQTRILDSDDKTEVNRLDEKTGDTRLDDKTETNRKNNWRENRNGINFEYLSDFWSEDQSRVLKCEYLSSATRWKVDILKSKTDTMCMKLLEATNLFRIVNMHFQNKSVEVILSCDVYVSNDERNQNNGEHIDKRNETSLTSSGTEKRIGIAVSELKGKGKGNGVLMMLMDCYSSIKKWVDFAMALSVQLEDNDSDSKQEDKNDASEARQSGRAVIDREAHSEYDVETHTLKSKLMKLILKNSVSLSWTDMMDTKTGKQNLSRLDRLEQNLSLSCEMGHGSMIFVRKQNKELMNTQISLLNISSDLFQTNLSSYRILHICHLKCNWTPQRLWLCLSDKDDNGHSIGSDADSRTTISRDVLTLDPATILSLVTLVNGHDNLCRRPVMVDSGLPSSPVSEKIETTVKDVSEQHAGWFEQVASVNEIKLECESFQSVVMDMKMKIIGIDISGKLKNSLRGFEISDVPPKSKVFTSKSASRNSNCSFDETYLSCSVRSVRLCHVDNVRDWIHTTEWNMNDDSHMTPFQFEIDKSEFSLSTDSSGKSNSSLDIAATVSRVKGILNLAVTTDWIRKCMLSLVVCMPLFPEKLSESSFFSTSQSENDTCNSTRRSKKLSSFDLFNSSGSLKVIECLFAIRSVSSFQRTKKTDRNFRPDKSLGVRMKGNIDENNYIRKNVRLPFGLDVVTVNQPQSYSLILTSRFLSQTSGPHPIPLDCLFCGHPAHESLLWVLGKGVRLMFSSRHEINGCSSNRPSRSPDDEPNGLMMSRSPPSSVEAFSWSIPSTEDVRKKEYSIDYSVQQLLFMPSSCTSVFDDNLLFSTLSAAERDSNMCVILRPILQLSANGQNKFSTTLISTGDQNDQLKISDPSNNLHSGQMKDGNSPWAHNMSNQNGGKTSGQGDGMRNDNDVSLNPFFNSTSASQSTTPFDLYCVTPNHKNMPIKEISRKFKSTAARFSVNRLFFSADPTEFVFLREFILHISNFSKSVNRLMLLSCPSLSSVSQTSPDPITTSISCWKVSVGQASLSLKNRTKLSPSVIARCSDSLRTVLKAALLKSSQKDKEASCSTSAELNEMQKGLEMIKTIREEVSRTEFDLLKCFVAALAVHEHTDRQGITLTELEVGDILVETPDADTMKKTLAQKRSGSLSASNILQPSFHPPALIVALSPFSPLETEGSASLSTAAAARLETPSQASGTVAARDSGLVVRRDKNNAMMCCDSLDNADKSGRSHVESSSSIELGRLQDNGCSEPPTQESLCNLDLGNQATSKRGHLSMIKLWAASPAKQKLMSSTAQNDRMAIQRFVDTAISVRAKSRMGRIDELQLQTSKTTKELKRWKQNLYSRQKLERKLFRTKSGLTKKNDCEDANGSCGNSTNGYGNFQHTEIKHKPSPLFRQINEDTKNSKNEFEDVVEIAVYDFINVQICPMILNLSQPVMGAIDKFLKSTAQSLRLEKQNEKTKLLSLQITAKKEQTVQFSTISPSVVSRPFISPHCEVPTSLDATDTATEIDPCLSVVQSFGENSSTKFDSVSFSNENNSSKIESDNRDVSASVEVSELSTAILNACYLTEANLLHMNSSGPDANKTGQLSANRTTTSGPTQDGNSKEYRYSKRRSFFRSASDATSQQNSSDQSYCCPVNLASKPTREVRLLSHFRIAPLQLKFSYHGIMRFENVPVIIEPRVVRNMLVHSVSRFVSDVVAWHIARNGLTQGFSSKFKNALGNRRKRRSAFVNLESMNHYINNSSLNLFPDDSSNCFQNSDCYGFVSHPLIADSRPVVVEGSPVALPQQLDDVVSSSSKLSIAKQFIPTFIRPRTAAEGMILSSDHSPGRNKTADQNCVGPHSNSNLNQIQNRYIRFEDAEEIQGFLLKKGGGRFLGPLSSSSFRRRKDKHNLLTGTRDNGTENLLYYDELNDQLITDKTETWTAGDNEELDTIQIEEEACRPTGTHTAVGVESVADH